MHAHLYVLQSLLTHTYILHHPPLCTCSCSNHPHATHSSLTSIHHHICTYFPHSLVDYLSSTTPYTSCSSSLLNCLHIVHTPLTPLLTIYHQPLHTHLVHYHYSIVCTLYRVVTLLAVMALEGSPYMDTSLRMRISS